MKIIYNKEQTPTTINCYEKFWVKEDSEYLVYSVRTFYGEVYYCICDEVFSYFPRWVPAEYFKLTDSRLSRYWVFGLDINEASNKALPFLSFSEWINDDYFYYDLVEGDSNDTNAIIFRRYKELMDVEFPKASVTEIAQIGDSQWIICPDCIDAWESSDDRDAIIKCPKCLKFFINPRYTG